MRSSDSLVGGLELLQERLVRYRMYGPVVDVLLVTYYRDLEELRRFHDRGDVFRSYMDWIIVYQEGRT